MLNSLSSGPPASARLRACALRRTVGELAFGQLLQREKVFGSLAALFRIVEYFAVAPRSSRTRAPASLILDGLCFDVTARLAPRRDVGFCVCLHALSSFQRTDPSDAAFAAPSNRSQGNLLMLRASGTLVNRHLAGRRLSRNRPPNEPRLGEPYEDTNRCLPCQPLIRTHAKYFQGRRRTCFRRRQEMPRTFRSIGPPWSRWVTSEADRQYTRAVWRSQSPVPNPAQMS